MAAVQVCKFCFRPANDKKKHTCEQEHVLDVCMYYREWLEFVFDHFDPAPDVKDQLAKVLTTQREVKD